MGKGACGKGVRSEGCASFTGKQEHSCVARIVVPDCIRAPFMVSMRLHDPLCLFQRLHFSRKKIAQYAERLRMYAERLNFRGKGAFRAFCRADFQEKGDDGLTIKR